MPFSINIPPLWGYCLRIPNVFDHFNPIFALVIKSFHKSIESFSLTGVPLPQPGTKKERTPATTGCPFPANFIGSRAFAMNDIKRAVKNHALLQKIFFLKRILKSFYIFVALLYSFLPKLLHRIFF
jgi:hypothetical protein